MRAVEVSESWAEGKRMERTSELSGFIVCDKVAWRAAARTTEYTAIWAESSYKRRTLAYQIETLRDIFGNPFRPGPVDPTWRTPTAVAIIYAERAFDRLPILADALEDAGCTHVDLLNHCRQPGDHVRGCWALDLVLGKE